jgi:hypothetical protein
MTALEIINELGGVMQVSRDLAVSFTTVSSWGRANQIPAWRQPKVLELAVEKGVALSTSDFPSPEERVTLGKVAA